jgi:hypothetical protein
MRGRPGPLRLSVVGVANGPCTETGRTSPDIVATQVKGKEGEVAVVSQPVRAVVSCLCLLAAALLSGCASAPSAGAGAGPQADASATADAGEPETVIEAIHVLPHAYPIQVVAHIRPGPCVSAGQASPPCAFGVAIPGASAGLAWNSLRQSYGDAEGLFWRIQLTGNWTRSTPAVQSLQLTVATQAASCGNCTARVAFDRHFPSPEMDVDRTDVFLRPGEDTLLFWVEPKGIANRLAPADDVEVELHGWATAFVADGEPIRLTTSP